MAEMAIQRRVVPLVRLPGKLVEPSIRTVRITL
jgi:hypothetical protein